jgi:hypothetical protein
LEWKAAKTPVGLVGQVRPHRRFSAEEAHRPPHGKRSRLERKSTAKFNKPIKKTADSILQSYAFKRVYAI